MNGYIYKAAILGLGVIISSCGDKDTDYTDLVQFPRVTVPDTSFVESNGDARVSVILSWPYEQDVEVSYEITESPSSALKAGSDDFTGGQGSLVIKAGERAGLIPLEILDDEVPESNEAFQVKLTSVKYGKVTKAECTVTINNDDEGIQITDSGPMSPKTYPGYTLVWEDDFKEEKINPANWTHEIGAGGWGNEELQYYTNRTSNSFTYNGYLVIEARNEKFQGSNYTSARLISRDKKQFKYGRIDIRAKMPKGKGMWPALWMLGSNFSSVGWPACGEIDICEVIGNQPQIAYGTAHFGPNPANRAYKGGNSFLLQGSYADDFHVFSIIWKQNSIEWQRDGIKYFTLTPADLGANEWPFNNPFFFIMNVAVGGNWPGNPDNPEIFPQRMIVDYIRVFQ